MFKPIKIKLKEEHIQELEDVNIYFYTFLIETSHLLSFNNTIEEYKHMFVLKCNFLKNGELKAKDMKVVLNSVIENEESLVCLC